MLRRGITAELYNLIKTGERGLKEKSKDVLVVDGFKGKNQGKWKGRGFCGKKNDNSSWVVFKGGDESRIIPPILCILYIYLHLYIGLWILNI